MFSAFNLFMFQPVNEEGVPMFLVDSHCHLDRLDYRELHTDLASVLQKAAARSVGHMLTVATSLEDFSNFFPRARELSAISFSCGVHPLNLSSRLDSEQLYKLALEPKVVAIGETGLDYHYQQEDLAVQRQALCQHIEVARRVAKPLIIHSRSASQDLIALLQSQRASECGGVMHCFNDSRENATTFLDMGFYLSISGIVTFRNAQELRAVVPFIPLDRLLIETDSPYLAPVPYRGKENQPSYVHEVAEAVAALKRITLERLAEATTENFYRLFYTESARSGGL